MKQMTVHIIDNGSKYRDQLVNLFAIYKPSVVGYDEIDRSSIADGDIVVLSGGHGHPVLWHDKDYAREIDIIKTHPGPIIGVCLGAQLIAHVFGSHLHYLGYRSKGMKAVHLTKEGKEMLEDRAYTVYENHNWSAQSVSNPLTCLAVSDDGVEIFKHATRPLYGLQFHPEEGGDPDGKILFDEILATILSTREDTLHQLP